MSQVANCPTCGGKSKTKEVLGKTTYQAIENDELLKKVAQLKKAMQTFKNKAEILEQQLEEINSRS